MPKTYDGTSIRVKADLHEWWADRLKRRIPAREVSFVREELHSIIVRGDTIYSYGSHFPMAQVFRHKRGDVRLVLLNGDRWSGASGYGHGTTYDQTIVRQNVEAAGVPYIIVPFSALDAAGIERSTLQPVEVRADRYTYAERRSRDRPGAHAFMDDPSGATRPRYASRWGWHIPTGEHTPDVGRYTIGTPAEPGAEGALNGTYYVEDGVTPLRVEDPLHAQAPREAHAYPAAPAELQSDGYWTWTMKRHWLGDSLFRARVADASPRTRWAYFISSFDYNEPHAPYFLCEVPAKVERDGQVYRPKPSTVDEAIDWLRPDVVVQAQRAGVEVLRQGDIFAIPTAHTTKELRAIGRTPRAIELGIMNRHLKGKPMVLGTNHAPTHAIVVGDDVYGRGRLYHTPDGRPADHRAIDLGDRKTWYRLVKNTVPLDHQRQHFTRIGVGNSIAQSAQSRAWTIGGGVD